MIDEQMTDDDNLYRGPSDIREGCCPQCSRKMGQDCLGPDLFDAGPFYHRARFGVIGVEPEDMDGGAVLLFDDEEDAGD